MNAKANLRDGGADGRSGVALREACAKPVKLGSSAVSIGGTMDSDDNPRLRRRITTFRPRMKIFARVSARLSRLASYRLPLEAMLTQVATYAVQAIPGADGAGLTLLEQDRADTIVSTAPFVTEIDDIQYEMGQGPCISAAREGRTVLSGSLGGDSRWPRFGGRAARLGVHSVVSLPLITPDGVVGAMNVYAHDKNVFDDRAAELGQVFAAPAAIAVQNAHVLAQTQRLADQLQSALGSAASSTGLSGS